MDEATRAAYTARWHLIQTLDDYALILCIVVFLTGLTAGWPKYKGCKRIAFAMDLTYIGGGIVIMLYLMWRLFFCWWWVV